VNGPRPAALIVEDEAPIRRFVRMALEAEGWNVVESGTMRQGLIDAGTQKPDLVILDLGLPDGDGVDLLRDLRGWSTVPVIVLSARSDEQDKIAALDAGADDYLTKPFSTGELLARVRANLRRAGTLSHQETRTFRFGDVEVDQEARVVRKGQTEVHLSPTEYRLLAFLVGNAGKVLTHRQILQHVWGPAYLDRDHYVRIHMSHLRQKLEADPAQPRYLTTETAVGYRLITEVAESK
jgi:two-component system, OmpR family, KDP operon response regulator KdpE